MEKADRKLALYVAHRAALVDYASPIVGCRATAEDVVQEAFMRFAAPGAQTTPEAAVKRPINYLYRIVKNLAIDCVRRISSQAPRNQAMPNDFLDLVASDTPTPEDEALYKQELDIVQRAIRELPERTQRAFEMYRLEGLPLREVAARLDISITLVHQLVQKAVTHCANRLDEAND